MRRQAARPPPPSTLAGGNHDSDCQTDHATLFRFNQSISFMVYCENQEEIDHFWEKLSAVPEAEQCDWLKDRYGLSWQVVPAAMDHMMRSGSAEQIARFTQALLKMKKFDLAELDLAFNGVSA
jgi:predicted 3-demethylubiquinone-9 3-methyltransferase (glyoxalase superfamily)